MNLKNMVQTLLSLSLNAEGVVDPQRVGAVCVYVSEKFAPVTGLKVLRAYKKKIGLEIAANSARIASAGPLDDASRKSLEAFVKSKNKNAQVEFINDESLLAGVQARVGDTVWENSVRMKLEELRESLGA